jgi:hypothetical protein
VKERDRLLHLDSTNDNDEYAEEEQRAKAIEELNDHIKDVADKIKAVWGHTIDQLTKMSTEELLAPDDPSTKLLGTTKSIYASGNGTFAKRDKALP